MKYDYELYFEMSEFFYQHSLYTYVPATKKLLDRMQRVFNTEFLKFADNDRDFYANFDDEGKIVVTPLNDILVMQYIFKDKKREPVELVIGKKADYMEEFEPEYEEVIEGLTADEDFDEDTFNDLLMNYLKCTVPLTEEQKMRIEYIFNMNARERFKNIVYQGILNNCKRK